MKPMRILERDITKTVRQYLEWRGWRSVRINAGPFGKSGMPDFLFLHYERRLAVWIEFKAPRGRLSVEQTAWIEEERRRGAICLVVRDIDEFIGWYERSMGEEGQLRLKVGEA